MGAAADQVHPFKLLEAVAGTEVKHLAQVVGQVESRAQVDADLVFPLERRYHAFEADAAFEVG